MSSGSLIWPVSVARHRKEQPPWFTIALILPSGRQTDEHNP
jgi:hypothetical protein